MTDLTNLPIGTRVVWSKMDPSDGYFGVSLKLFGKVAVIISGPHPHRTGAKSYHVDFDESATWAILSTMIELETGPW